MTNPNALPFDADSWPENQRKGWRLGVGIPPTLAHYVGITQEGKVAYQVPEDQHIYKDSFALCYMLPPPRVLTFRVGLFRNSLGDHYVAIEPRWEDHDHIRWLTPAEMAEGRVALDAD